MEYLALKTAEYENKSTYTDKSSKTKVLATDATKTAKTLEAKTKEISKKIAAAKSQREVLSILSTTVEELIIGCEVAINQTEDIKSKLIVRNSDLIINDSLTDFAAEGYKKAFYEKADEAQALENELPAIELRLSQR
jgi:hypothetical protein